MDYFTDKGVRKMATAQQYEAYKNFLYKLNLSPAQIEKKLKEWCRKNNF